MNVATLTTSVRRLKKSQSTSGRQINGSQKNDAMANLRRLARFPLLSVATISAGQARMISKMSQSQIEAVAKQS